jgi:hypothetical protein
LTMNKMQAIKQTLMNVNPIKRSLSMSDLFLVMN